MQGTMVYGPRDIRFEDRLEPTITKSTDAIICLSATCICGSDSGRIAVSSQLLSQLLWVTSIAASWKKLVER
jgi:threonine dehydrogenase-like Zn-dependent dehydrogenase